MKRAQILLVVAVVALLSAATAGATSWRINPSPHANAQFKTVEEAMNCIDVLNGDTLLLDPATHPNINTQARKNITIIGPGYFLDQNKNWAESQSAIVGCVTLGENSKIEGCIITNWVDTGETCTVSRCRINSCTARKNSIVERCFIETLSCSESVIARNNIITSSDRYSPSRVYGSSGCLFENNVVINYPTSPYSYGLLINNFSNSTIRNNIIINLAQGFDSNQIPYSTYVMDFNGDNNNVIQNNVFSTPASYANERYPHNLYVGATVENTFINVENSDDGKYQLLDTSAAKGAATHGGDCGAFGGATPYVLSGIPLMLPHITEALVPAKPTDGKITVKLKIENQNE